MAQAEAIPWSDPEEAQRRMIARVCALPRPGMKRDVRDLTLLATVTTAGPLALVALGVGASPPLATVLGGMALAAMGTSVRLHRREHLLVAFPSETANTSRWKRAAFALIRGRHKPATETRGARVTVGAGTSTRGTWVGRG